MLPLSVYELYDLQANPNQLQNLYVQKSLAAVTHELKVALQKKTILDFDYLPLPIAKDPGAREIPYAKAQRGGRKLGQAGLCCEYGRATVPAACCLQR